jgi:hypothetical protein
MYVFIHGAEEWIRTSDTRIFNPLLYQLSYIGVYGLTYENRTHDSGITTRGFAIKLTPT